jgi:8-oxo-dGTP diphosphatase
LVVAAAVLREDGSLLAARRIGKSAGFWELPGGKVEDGEGPLGALQREIREELGISICFASQDGMEVGDGFTIDEDRILRVYKCALSHASQIPLVNGSHEEIRWLEVDEWLDVEWLPVDLEAVLLLRSTLI